MIGSDWTRETTLLGFQDCVLALAQPAHVQLCLLPTFVCPAAFLLHSFLHCCWVVEVNPSQHLITQSEAEVLKEIREQVTLLCLAGGNDLQSNLYYFVLNPDEGETEGNILSRQALQTSSQWDTLRQVAFRALLKLDWTQSAPSFLHQPNSMNLKNSVIVFNDDVQFGVTYEVEIESGSGLLLAKYLYCADFHCGDELVHLLEIETMGKAKMLALLKTQHNLAESLLPTDALLLELIYLSFGNWWQLHTWLWNNHVPFYMWF